MPQNPLSSPKDKKDTTPAAPTPPNGYQLTNLPAFIRYANVNTKIVPAAQWDIPNLGKVIADVSPANPQTIEVRDPKLFAQQPYQTHESTHVYQYSRNPAFVDGSRVGHSTVSSDYDYGGISGMENALRNHKTIANFNLEQQAQIVADYQRMTADALRRKDAKYLARITAAYHPFVSQLAHIPPKGADMKHMTPQDLAPAAPGLPPPTVIGVPLAPDLLLGGDPVYPMQHSLSQLKTMAAMRAPELQYKSKIGNPAATGIKIGTKKTFSSGKIGVWDGHGWRAQP
jgi:hypothetical protein